MKKIKKKTSLIEIAKSIGFCPLKDKQTKARIDTTHAIIELFAAVLDHCKQGGTVRIKNFGTFSSHIYKGRTVNSLFGAKKIIPFSDVKVLKFRSSNKAKEFLNMDKKDDKDTSKKKLIKDGDANIGKTAKSSGKKKSGRKPKIKK